MFLVTEDQAPEPCSAQESRNISFQNVLIVLSDKLGIVGRYTVLSSCKNAVLVDVLSDEFTVNLATSRRCSSVCGGAYSPQCFGANMCCRQAVHTPVFAPIYDICIDVCSSDVIVYFY
jgi:hypothetical protein